MGGLTSVGSGFRTAATPVTTSRGNSQTCTKAGNQKLAQSSSSRTQGTVASRQRLQAAAQDTVVSAVQDKLQSDSSVIQLFRYPGLSAAATQLLVAKAHSKGLTGITGLKCETCFNINVTAPLTAAEAETLSWLLRETYEPENLSASSMIEDGTNVVEVGPRLSFSTAWSANAVSVCESCSLTKVTRVERSRRFVLASKSPLTQAELDQFAALVHDRMTEQVYGSPLQSFQSDHKPEAVKSVLLIEEGMPALEAIDDELGLAFDDWDKDYYYKMFALDLKRNPTNVELFDLAQSNSEHCRHWFFGGDIVIDGTTMPSTLFELVKATYEANPNNSVVAFKDNSSAILGGDCSPMLPENPGVPSPVKPTQRTWDLLLTAETHNFPCGVAPYPGAETGTGGRIRDTHATGTGSIMGAATAGYCVGNLNMPGYELPWEDANANYPDSLAQPLQILVDASNGASDYGNKFGEPVVGGYTRTYGERLPNGERREWIKPIMFSGGVGQIDRDHHKKDKPEVGMLVVKIGGPAYRIGMGGGAASSAPGGGSDKAELNFNAVQRGDAEMSQKLWRVVRACVEMGKKNPIVQIHDQGSGGNCNVVKEIIYPLGAEIDIRKVKLGDATMSVLEIWGAEYQENDCILIKPEDEKALQDICDRERCFMQVIGACNGSGKIVLVDPVAKPSEPTPVDLDLETVLGALPKKTFSFDSYSMTGTTPLVIPDSETAMTALDRILRLPSVGSKRFLTTKVDRCVTGLIAQQQCVGPYQIPIADVAVMAQSHQGLTGLATSIGEQPIKGLLNPAAMARLAITESLTNIVWAPITGIADIRCSVNWMHAAKLKCEGAAMYETAEALKDAMILVGMACDGGKDSLSMVAKVDGENVMAPPQLVVSSYVGCTNITQIVTPDLKLPGKGTLLHIDLGSGKHRTGGSALAQVYNQIGNETPDVRMAQVKLAFEVTQGLITKGKISAGHDVSDGGVAVALLEMAFAGVGGIQVDLPAGDVMSTLFAEEMGMVIEVPTDSAAAVQQLYQASAVSCNCVGTVTAGSNAQATISVGGVPAIQGSVVALRDVWEATSFQLERLQATPETVAVEEAGLQFRQPPRWKMTYRPAFTSPDALNAENKAKVAIIREEGSNGDREMAAAVYAAGMQPWDITMSDLLSGRATLEQYDGIVFVGGFSYADTLDSAKGWASSIKFSKVALPQFEAFYARPDTFSLGVCNGCQLMALLGWVPGNDASSAPLPDLQQPRFVHNESERFECRWATVQIQESPAIMLKGMAGSNIGVWTAHGEGKCLFPDLGVKNSILEGGLAPIRYSDFKGEATEVYPYNPNGSPLGIAALCSPNGRHLAMMPHPERAYLGWQLPYFPQSSGLKKTGAGPWLKIFQNAAEWLAQQ